MKGLFDKLGINFKVIKVGTFKSAVEPYIMDEMSCPARAQLDTLYGNIWNHLKKEMAGSRHISVSAIDRLINEDYIMYATPETAVKGKLIDKTVANREMKAILARLVGKDPEKMNFVSPELLMAQTGWGTAYSKKGQIAVLYATGEIS